MGTPEPTRPTAANPNITTCDPVEGYAPQIGRYVAQLTEVRNDLKQEVAGWLPWAECVVVKQGHGTNAAASVHPERARTLIREAAERAVRNAVAGDLRPLRLDTPVVIEVEYRRGVEADFAAIVPGAQRVGDRGVRFEAADAVTGYRGFLAGVRLASTTD